MAARPRLWRIRTARFRLLAPTSLPGVSFLARGRIWFGSQPGGTVYPTGSSGRLRSFAACAATLEALQECVLSATEQRWPEQIFAAQQEATIALAHWQPCPSGLLFRGRLRLTLPESDLIRSEEFAAARRAARLDAVLADDAAKALSKAHLGDLTRARLWWLRQYLDQPDADRSWLAFDKHVLPLVVAADRPEDEVEKLAHILLTASDRMSGDSQLRDTLLQVLQHTFEIMNWTDLAADVESIGDGPEQAELINSKLTPAG